MKTRIACVSCSEFFEPDIQEVDEFIARSADAKVLAKLLAELERHPSIPPEYRQTIEQLQKYMAFLLMTYCPYCREVKFGKATCPELPRGRLSEAKYVQGLRREINKNGGFQIRPIPEDYVALVDDADEN